MRITACLNGDRRPGDHPALPVTADQVAADAAAAVGAGAHALHLHPRDARGAQELGPQVLSPLLAQVRQAVGGVPLSVTTALTAEPDPWRRYDLVQRWGAMPDAAVVHLHEAGAVEVARLLLDRRVAVEAGLATVEAARLLVATELAGAVARILVEPAQEDPEEALQTADAIDAVLDRAGVPGPRTLHGTGAAAWPLLDAAIATGRDIRIGLEDTLAGPDGREAEGNAALVAEAVQRVSAAAPR